MTRTTTYFKPTEGEARLDQDEFRDESDRLLRVECPRLLKGSTSATGNASLRVQYDRNGAVQQAQIVHTSGDEQMDTIWGALAARLQFDPQAGQTEELRPGIIQVGYSCTPTYGATTLKLP